jgi:hypothetical protein
MTTAVLCMPRPGLGCFNCCPPIRPAGYDHADHRPSLTRLLRENRADYLADRLAVREITGLWCDGLGFLEPGERLAGCLLHPARNGGQDLRGPTGYQEKCAREWCIEARAWAELSPNDQDALIALCQGMDSFTFSSRRLNPVMRLLGFGPQVAAMAAARGSDWLAGLDSLIWLDRAQPWQGWLLARLVEQGRTGLDQAEAAEILTSTAQDLARGLEPQPPLESGLPLSQVFDDPWEARFWRMLLKRHKARPAEAARWRRSLERLLTD